MASKKYNSKDSYGTPTVIQHNKGSNQTLSYLNINRRDRGNRRETITQINITETNQHRHRP